MPGDERSLQAPGLIDPVPRALSDGALEVLGVLPRASNMTFLARCVADDDEVLAVYKPQAGETPLWDFAEGTLHRREVAAYATARALGWPDVPATVVRDGPFGVGSVQRYVDVRPDEHYFTLEEEHADAFRRVALFDHLVNNADRKAGHCLLGLDGRIWCVDHGVCFAVEPKLRTVIWEFVDEPIPPVLVRDLARLRENLERGGSLRRELDDLLDPDEVEAVRERTRSLLEAGCFPGPGPGRPYPWPPI